MLRTQYESADVFSGEGVIWTQLQEIVDNVSTGHHGDESASSSSSTSSSPSTSATDSLGGVAKNLTSQKMVVKSEEMRFSKLSPMVLSKASHSKLKQQMLSGKLRNGKNGSCDLGYHTLSQKEQVYNSISSASSDSSIRSKPYLPPPNSVSGLPHNVYSSPYSTPNSSLSSSDLWDVRATKTPVSQLHILAEGARQMPVARLLKNKGRQQYNNRSVQNPFEQLPDSILVHILSFVGSSNQLATCSRVSRRFYFLAWEPVLWRSVVIQGEDTDADFGLKTIIRLLSRNSSIQELPMDSVILSGCPRLTDRGLALLARRCPQLRQLHIQYCHNVTNGGLMDLLTKCAFLEHLDVTGCSMISTISVHQPPMPPPPPPNQVNQSPHRGMMLPRPNSTINFRRTLNLQYLDMTDCASLEDSGLKILVESCPNLLYLYLRRCVNVTDVGLKYVASYCLSLREFSISDCVQVTDFGLYELAKLGPNLRYLSVAKCDRISDSGIKQIAKLCYKLRYLNVRGCEAVSDDSIETLARSCSRLRSLDVGKCEVTDVSLKMLSEHCPNLKKLSVKSCEMVSDQGIQSIAYYCRGLQQLNIQDCPITINGYRSVKKFCRRCIIEHSNPGFF